MKLSIVWWLPAVLLAGCAPAVSREPLGTPDTAVVLTEAERGAACRTGRVGLEGELRWQGEGGASDVQIGRYDVRCEDRAFSLEGDVLRVQARTFADALALFDEDAFLLAYFADLRVDASTPGRLDVRNLSEVPGSLIDDVRGVTITVVRPDGTRAALLSNLAVTPVVYDPERPVDLYFETTRAVVVWSRVTLDVKRGLIVAYR